MPVPHSARLQGLTPRRRRMLLATTAVLLVVALGVGTAVLVTANAGHQAVPGPPLAAGKPVVLLVPGYGGRSAALEALASRLTDLGRQARTLDPVGDGTGDLTLMVDRLEAAVGSARAAGAAPVDVVGYSAGGVVAALWANRHDGAARVGRIISLGSPFAGTELAAAGAAAGPQLCPLGCRQLLPGSTLLGELLVDGTPTSPHPAWLSVWTQTDRTVQPPESSRLAGAVNLPLQDRCPQLAVGHGGLPSHPVVVRIVAETLASPGSRPPSPSAEVCAG